MQDDSVPDGVIARSSSAASARRWAGWIAVALIVVGVIVDLTTPPRYAPSAIFAAAPLVAAPLLSASATALTGIVATSAFVGCLLFVGAPALAESVTAGITVVTVSFLALGINYIVRRVNRRLASARDIAAAAQLAVLPTPPARIGDLEVAAHYAAADVDARIGGDLYAVQETPYGTRLIVGDVRGKGIGSVAAVAIVVGAFREAAEEEPSLQGVADRLDRALRREVGRRHGPEKIEEFTTAALAEFPFDEPGRVRFVNRGHPPPLLFADAAAVYLESSAPALPLGLTELGRWPVPLEESRFPSGAQLLLYTDGLSESRDALGRFYDPLRRLSGRTFAGPAALLNAVLADVAAHTGGGAADDMALLAVGRRRVRTGDRAAS